MKLTHWSGIALDRASRSDLITAVRWYAHELERERNGQAFREKVLARIVPFPQEPECIKLSGIVFTNGPLTEPEPT